MDSQELTFEQRVDLIRLMAELRQAPPLGIVGLLEIRNLLSNLFPEFDTIRDGELDDLIQEYAAALGRQPSDLPPDAVSEQNGI